MRTMWQRAPGYPLSELDKLRMMSAQGSSEGKPEDIVDIHTENLSKFSVETYELSGQIFPKAESDRIC
jgi:hypothetical protein